MAEMPTARSQPRGRVKGGLLAGAAYPFQALAVLNRAPQLWRYVLIPILVNVVVGATVYLGLLLLGLRTIDGHRIMIGQDLRPHGR